MNFEPDSLKSNNIHTSSVDLPCVSLNAMQNCIQNFLTKFIPEALSANPLRNLSSIVNTYLVNPLAFTFYLVKSPNVKSVERFALSQFNINYKILNEVLENAHLEAENLAKDLEKINIESKSSESNRLLQRFRYGVNENLEQATEILQFIETNQLEGEELESKTRLLKRKYTRLLKVCNEKCEREHKVEELRTHNHILNVYNEPFSIAKPMADPLQKPVEFYNTKNKCWMHSSLQLLLAIKNGEWLSDAIKAHADREIPSAINHLIDSVKAGSVSRIDSASNRIHSTLALPERENAHPELTHDINSQKDAAIFFESVLPDLDYSFTLETCRVGLDDKEHCQLIRQEKTSLLQLNFSEKISSIQEMIDQNFTPKIIEDDTWRYDDVEEVPRYKTWSAIRCQGEKTPDYLFVQLVRFTKMPDEEYQKALAKREKKVNRLVCFFLKTFSFQDAVKNAELRIDYVNPMTKIKQTLSSEMSENGTYLLDFSKAFGDSIEVQYELVGLVHHQGSIKSGHYTADVLRENSATGERQWYYCNDVRRQVRRISPEEVRAGDAYILALRKVESAPFDSSEKSSA